uniref:Uncharacterized protein n=1 Tax=Cacopsylla melanoneura TaxID=428564 RepID=A0A8D8T5R5_9HEMI
MVLIQIYDLKHLRPEIKPRQSHTSKLPESQTSNTLNSSTPNLSLTSQNDNDTNGTNLYSNQTLKTALNQRNHTDGLDKSTRTNKLVEGFDKVMEIAQNDTINTEANDGLTKETDGKENVKIETRNQTNQKFTTQNTHKTSRIDQNQTNEAIKELIKSESKPEKKTNSSGISVTETSNKNHVSQSVSQQNNTSEELLSNQPSHNRHGTAGISTNVNNLTTPDINQSLELLGQEEQTPEMEQTTDMQEVSRLID